MKIVTAAEMREIDRITTQKYGVPSLTLMENAGSAVAEFILQEYPQAQRIGLICGKGNNGGDGFVCARKLHEAGKQVSVLLLADPADLKGDAATMYARLPVKAVLARKEDEFSRPEAQAVYDQDLLVDAILGTGFQPPVGGLYQAAIERFLDEFCPVVAVDIPSGYDADSFSAAAPGEGVARADSVVTFTAPRSAHVWADFVLRGGEIRIVPIGSPPEAITSKLDLELITAREVAALLKRRRREAAAHKGDFGHVLVVGGSVGKAGAAAMAGMAALRSGAGLVTVACPRSVLPTVAGFAPELMTVPLEETDSGSISSRALEYNRFQELVRNKTVLAIGPGLSQHPDTVAFVNAVAGTLVIPLVMDADALNAFPTAADLGRSVAPTAAVAKVVITPHPGEASRLLSCSTAVVQQDRLKAARLLANDSGAAVVLKGRRTVIAGSDPPIRVNPTGNPGLATGGTGDVLTGLIAGFIAQFGTDPSVIAAGVYLHGLAGDIAREHLGEQAMIATDLLKYLPEAFRRVRQQAREKFVRIHA